MKQSLVRHMKNFHSDQVSEFLSKAKTFYSQRLDSTKFDLKKEKEKTNAKKSLPKNGKCEVNNNKKRTEKIDIYNMKKVARKMKTPGSSVLNESSTDSDI